MDGVRRTVHGTEAEKIYHWSVHRMIGAREQRRRKCHRELQYQREAIKTEGKKGRKKNGAATRPSRHQKPRSCLGHRRKGRSTGTKERAQYERCSELRRQQTHGQRKRVRAAVAATRMQRQCAQRRQRCTGAVAAAAHPCGGDTKGERRGRQRSQGAEAAAASRGRADTDTGARAVAAPTDGGGAKVWWRVRRALGRWRCQKAEVGARTRAVAMPKGRDGCGAHSGGGDAKRQRRVRCPEAEADTAGTRVATAPTDAHNAHTGGGKRGRCGAYPGESTANGRRRSSCSGRRTRTAAMPRGSGGCGAHEGGSDVNECVKMCTRAAAMPRGSRECNAHSAESAYECACGRATRTRRSTAITERTKRRDIDEKEKEKGRKRKRRPSTPPQRQVRVRANDVHPGGSGCGARAGASTKTRTNPRGQIMNSEAQTSKQARGRRTQACGWRMLKSVAARRNIENGGDARAGTSGTWATSTARRIGELRGEKMELEIRKPMGALGPPGTKGGLGPKPRVLPKAALSSRKKKWPTDGPKRSEKV
ncbi:hypothetical protein C8R47DRAFT_1084770 [Mycena vitilis]|nr:hypothetical protein C8R47DRAFT_1084770 [Mycena vitilis]